MNYVYVAVGSAVGGLARYVVGEWFRLRVDMLPRSSVLAFPLGTVVVNVTGSFLLGFLVVAIDRHPHAHDLRLLLAVGLCGGYTTFSAFSFETMGLLETGSAGLAALNVGASLLLAGGATFGGMLLGRVVR